MHLVLCSETILVRMRWHFFYKYCTMYLSLTIFCTRNIFTMIMYLCRSETFKVHYLMFLLVLLKALDVLLNAVSYEKFVYIILCKIGH